MRRTRTFRNTEKLFIRCVLFYSLSASAMESMIPVIRLPPVSGVSLSAAFAADDDDDVDEVRIPEV